MNTEDKQKLVDAINCKFPQNNIMELYYDIGRVLPFTAQRFPDGRVSAWYRNQYVQVVRVEPHGRFGKYGTAYGFYYRNGERADSSDTPELCWCKKDDTEPQPIPNCGCGSWALLEIQVQVAQEHEVKVLGLDDVFTFGKYRGKTLQSVYSDDVQYLKWMESQNPDFIIDWEKLTSDSKS